MNNVSVDQVRGLVRVTVKDFCTPETVDVLGGAVRAAVRSLGPAVGAHLTLYDVSAIPVAPPATIDALNATLARPDVMAVKARKVAFVTPSALSRIQLARVRSDGQAVAVFPDVRSAEAWLLN